MGPERAGRRPRFIPGQRCANAEGQRGGGRSGGRFPVRPVPRPAAALRRSGAGRRRGLLRPNARPNAQPGPRPRVGPAAACCGLTCGLTHSLARGLAWGPLRPAAPPAPTAYPGPFGSLWSLSSSPRPPSPSASSQNNHAGCRDRSSSANTWLLCKSCCNKGRCALTSEFVREICSSASCSTARAVVYSRFCDLMLGCAWCGRPTEPWSQALGEHTSAHPAETRGAAGSSDGFPACTCLLLF